MEGLQHGIKCSGELGSRALEKGGSHESRGRGDISGEAQETAATAERSQANRAELLRWDVPRVKIDVII